MTKKMNEGSGVEVEQFHEGDFLILGYNEFEPHEPQGIVLDAAGAVIANAALASKETQ